MLFSMTLFLESSSLEIPNRPVSFLRSWASRLDPTHITPHSIGICPLELNRRHLYGGSLPVIGQPLLVEENTSNNLDKATHPNLLDARLPFSDKRGTFIFDTHLFISSIEIYATNKFVTSLLMCRPLTRVGVLVGLRSTPRPVVPA